MATTKWRGDAAPVRQIDKVLVTNVGIGDTFTITCNRKSITFVATDTLAATVYAGLTAMLGDDATVPEFSEITPLDTYNGDTNGLWLQGPEDGTPFIVTVAKTNGATAAINTFTTVNGAPGKNCKQTVTVTGTGGTFTLTFLGATTGNIAYNASAATVQTALRALSTIGSTGCSVTDGGTSGNTYRWIVEFTGPLGYATQSLLVGDGSSLSGAVFTGIVTEKTKGAPSTNHRMTMVVNQSAAGEGTGTPRGVLSFVFTNPFTSAIGYGDAFINGGYSDNSSIIQSTLEGIIACGTGNVTVTRTLSTTTQDTYLIEFVSAFAGTDMTTALGVSYSVDTVTLDYTTRVGSATTINEVQTLTFDSKPAGGTWTLTFKGSTTAALAYNISAGSLQTAIQGLASVGASNATVTSTTSGAGQIVWTVTFAATLGAADQPAFTMTTTNLTGGPVLVSLTQTGATGTNEVQAVAITNTGGGTFTLTYSGQTTSAIAYDASASTIQVALEALSNIAPGDVAVSGPPGGPWTITFGGTLLYTDVVQITADGSSLTQGAGTETITKTSIVSPTGANWYSEANNWTGGAAPSSGDTIIFESSTIDCLYGFPTSLPGSMTIRVLASYTGKIGLPEWNALGYYEYRAKRLTIGDTSGTVTIAVGQGDGDGSTRLRFDTGAAATTIDIWKTDQSDDDTTRAFDWIGTLSTNVIRVHNGQCAIAPYGPEAATFATLTNSENGDVLIGAGATTTVITSQGDLLTRSPLVTSLTINDGTVKSYGILNSATITITGGTWESHNSGTATAVTVGPGTIDCSDDYTAKTFTTLTLKQGATVTDPNHIITATTLTRGSDVDELVMR